MLRESAGIRAAGPCKAFRTAVPGTCGGRGRHGVNLLDMASSFTAAHRRFARSAPAICEAMCLEAQFPAILGDIRPEDRFAGRAVWPAVGFRLFSGGDSECMGFYCNRGMIKAELDRKDLPASDRRRWCDLLEYWSPRATFNRIRAEDDALDRPGLAATVLHGNEFRGPMIGNYVYRASGITLDFSRLLKTGIPGMIARVEKLAASAKSPDARSVYQGMRICLSVLCSVCRFYARQAGAMAMSTLDSRRREELLAMSLDLSAITQRRPKTLSEAIQLFWLYALVANADNFGRMDVYLAGFCARDLESGRLDEAGALGLLQALWRLIADEIPGWSGRIFVGGLGRPDEQASDRFALLAIEASRTVRKLMPQLSLRWHGGMNPALLDKALDAIGEGCVFPMLYNDEVNVPAMQEVFRVNRVKAEQYVASDCGEFGLDHASLGFPDGNLVLIRALLAALHNGMDPKSGAQAGLRTGTCEELAAFEDLWRAYSRQVEYFTDVIFDRLLPMFRVQEREVNALFPAMLTDDCLKRGRGLFSGVRHKGLLIEIYGTINVADSLTAIKREVYDRRVFSLADLVRMVDADFAGFEKERLLLLNAPKYGNDDEAADAMAQRVYSHICEAARANRKRLKLDFCLADLINAGGHVALGREMGALPDGRKAGEPLANANGPSNGRDLGGPTALLNSLVKLRPSAIGGQVQHLKFNREMFRKSRPKLEALLKTYFAGGGSQATIMALDRDALQQALKEPENHGDLIVRIGGYCERFVALPSELQADIIARTMYD